MYIQRTFPLIQYFLLKEFGTTCCSVTVFSVIHTTMCFIYYTFYIVMFIFVIVMYFCLKKKMIISYADMIIFGSVLKAVF